MKTFLPPKTLLATATGAFLLLPLAASAGHTNTVLTAQLDGRQEVPSNGNGNGRRIVGDANGRGEAYVFGIDGDAETLCYVLLVEKINIDDGGVAAHIHAGPRGDNGPVIASLAGPGDGNAADCLTEGETGKFPLHPEAGSGIVQDILNNPDEYYINVHNPDFPGGAIRGQLESVDH